MTETEKRVLKHLEADRAAIFKVKSLPPIDQVIVQQVAEFFDTHQGWSLNSISACELYYYTVFLQHKKANDAHNSTYLHYDVLTDKQRKWLVDVARFMDFVPSTGAEFFDNHARSCETCQEGLAQVETGAVP